MLRFTSLDRCGLHSRLVPLAPPAHADGVTPLCDALAAYLAVGLLLLTGCVDGQNNALGIGHSGIANVNVAPPEVHIEIVNETVTIRADNVALDDLLAEISLQSGLEVKANGVLDEPITLRIDALPFPEAIAGILRHRSYVLQYVPPVNAHRSKLWISANIAPHDVSSSAIASAGNATGDLEFEWTDDMTRLSEAMTDDDARVRLRAVAALADVGGYEAASALSATALSDGNPSVRAEAIHALSEVGGDNVIEVFKHALMDPDKQVRATAIEAFAEIGGDEAAFALAYALNSDDVRLRTAAVDALAEIRGEAALRMLEQGLGNQDGAVRDAAAAHLAELKDL